MFNFDKEVINIAVLDQAFNLSHLWFLREKLNDEIANVECYKETAINVRNVTKLKRLEKKLFFLNRNVQAIEEVMISKENSIFEFLICDEFCLN